jgi:flagella basal body P-ring formation protein FlgA
MPRLHAIHTALRFLALAAILALCAGQATAYSAEAGDWRLVFKTAACVDGPSVRVRDVAVPHGGVSQARWDHLGALELFKSPERGAPPVILDKPRLKDALFAVLGDDVHNCVLPGRLTIQRGGRVMDQSELFRRSVEALTPLARNLGGEVEFKEMTLPEFLLLPDDFDKLEVVPPATIRPGRVSFGLKVVSLSGKSVRHVAASGFLSLWKTVPCAAVPINRMDHLTPEKITFVRRNMAYLSSEVWDGRGGPYRATASVGVNQPLYLDGLELLPVVAKGDKINLVYEGKSLTLTTQAEAMADGAIGRTIPVRNLQTRTQVQATVRDAKTVVVR